MRDGPHQTMNKKDKVKESRKVISEEIVPKMFGDIDLSPPGWFELWFILKPRWCFQSICYWFRKKKQILTTGFPHEQSIEFSSELAKWALPRLKHLRDNTQGYPSHLIEGENPDYDKNWEERDDYGIKKWRDILDKIIWSFENLNNEPMPTPPADYDHSCKVIKYDDGSTEYVSLDKRSWDWTAVNHHREKVQEGLDLFGKYYLELWW
jgi:hypothetical protein